MCWAAAAAAGGGDCRGTTLQTGPSCCPSNSITACLLLLSLPTYSQVSTQCRSYCYQACAGQAVPCCAGPCCAVLCYAVLCQATLCSSNLCFDSEGDNITPLHQATDSQTDKAHPISLVSVAQNVCQRQEVLQTMTAYHRAQLITQVWPSIQKSSECYGRIEASSDQQRWR